jgi:predicted NUDIX family NTP pyrophosphohydrolase
MHSSAGILLFRHKGELEVLLVHPGGPFWRGRDEGAWMIPKGLIEPGETPELAARREVTEELGLTITEPLIDLGSFRQAGGKLVEAFAVERDWDPAALTSNAVTIEWPRGSESNLTFPEVDAARWFSLETARRMMLGSQQVLLDRLLARFARPQRD